MDSEENAIYIQMSEFSKTMDRMLSIHKYNELNE